MKAHRKIEFNKLLEETIRMLSMRFTPDLQQIKIRLESLIERGYIER